MARARDLLFRIFYSTSFTIVFLLLIAFSATTSADKIYQSYRRNRLVDVFIITGAYVIAAVIAVFLYSSRLYTNRSLLRDIPKTYLPIEKEDLPGKRVHRMIEESLARSAVVAYQAKPRSRRIEVEVPRAGERILAITRQTKTHNHEHHLTQDEQLLLAPTWGTVSHPGWQSPASEDMPSLEYASVVDQLIDLVEAKAVSLAPIDVLATHNEDGSSPPDQKVLELLTRPDMLGMRQYLNILAQLGVVAEGELCEEFLVSYERARFGATPVSEREFRQLMRMFAELLRSMQPVPVDLLQLGDSDDDDDDDRQLRRKVSSLSSAKSTFSASSVVHLPSFADRPPRRISEDSAPSMSEDEIESLRTAPSQRITQLETQSRSRSRGGTRFFSANSTRPSLQRGRSDMSVQSQKSSRSRRSAKSDRSGGSVIRLSEASGNALPYTIEVPLPGRRNG